MNLKKMRCLHVVFLTLIASFLMVLPCQGEQKAKNVEEKIISKDAVLKSAKVKKSSKTITELLKEMDLPAASGTAPSFSLKDLSGKNVGLDDYKDKVILLGFWTTW